MKLIDLLVKKTNEEGWGWPEGAARLAQDPDGDIQMLSNRHAYLAPSGWIGDGRGDFYGQYAARKIEPLSSDYTTSIVTREQYESALAASDGWIEWGGGECPVEEGTLVDVRFRDGDDDMNIEAIDLLWNHENWSADIIAYRLHKPDINSRAKDDRLEQDLNECIGKGVDVPEWNSDGIPPIGCACEMQDSKGTWLPVDIIAKNDGFTFGWSYDYRLVFFGDKADEFRPLRTEAQKVMESAKHIIAELCRDSASNGHSADLIMEAIAAGKIPGVKLEGK